MNRDATLKNLRNLIEESRDQFWPIAAFLHDIQVNDTSWVPEAADAVGIGRRRAFTLTKIFGTFSRMSVPVAELELIGWTKIAVIAGHVDKSPARLEEFLHMARTLSSRDLNLKLGGATDNANHTVLLTLNDGIVYKRVFNQKTQNRMLELKSDNPDFRAYSIPIQEVSEIWKSIGLLSFDLSKPVTIPEPYSRNEDSRNVENHGLQQIASIVMEMRKELDELKKTRDNK